MAPMIPKHELVLYGLYLAGGASDRIHTEEVALHCHRLFGADFAWERHPHLPDKEVVRHALRRARSDLAGPRVIGRTGGGGGQAGLDRHPVGWRLTEIGLRWVRQHEGRLRQVSGARDVDEQTLRARRRLQRYRDTKLFRDFENDAASFRASDSQLAIVLRCRVDADPSVWEQRLEEMRELAEEADDVVAARFAAACRQQLQIQRRAQAGS